MKRTMSGEKDFRVSRDSTARTMGFLAVKPGRSIEIDGDETATGGTRFRGSAAPSLPAGSAGTVRGELTLNWIRASDLERVFRRTERAGQTGRGDGPRRAPGRSARHTHPENDPPGALKAPTRSYAPRQGHMGWTGPAIRLPGPAAMRRACDGRGAPECRDGLVRGPGGLWGSAARRPAPARGGHRRKRRCWDFWRGAGGGKTLALGRRQGEPGNSTTTRSERPAGLQPTNRSAGAQAGRSCSKTCRSAPPLSIPSRLAGWRGGWTWCSSTRAVHTGSGHMAAAIRRQVGRLTPGARGLARRMAEQDAVLGRGGPCYVKHGRGRDLRQPATLLGRGETRSRVGRLPSRGGPEFHARPGRRVPG